MVKRNWASRLERVACCFTQDKEESLPSLLCDMLAKATSQLRGAKKDETEILAVLEHRGIDMEEAGRLVAERIAQQKTLAAAQSSGIRGQSSQAAPPTKADYAQLFLKVNYEDNEAISDLPSTYAVFQGRAASRSSIQKLQAELRKVGATVYGARPPSQMDDTRLLEAIGMLADREVGRIQLELERCGREYVGLDATFNKFGGQPGFQKRIKRNMQTTIKDIQKLIEQGAGWLKLDSVWYQYMSEEVKVQSRKLDRWTEG